jgi:uncharacterized membrane protein HdeD (DUF308 family)
MAQADASTPGTLLELLARNWWLLLLRGVAAILFGVLALIWPGVTLVALIALYAAYALVDGGLALVAAFRGGARVSRGWLVLMGLFGIAAGVITIILPGLTALVLVLVIGAWNLARGVVEIIVAIRLRKEIDNEWLLIASGLLSVIFGAALIARPEAGALALVWVIGSFAVVFGVLIVALSIRLRGRSASARA